MKVAIAGIGNVASYLIEELPKEGHELVALTRSHKPILDELKVTQRVTDYTESSLAEALKDCDAVINTISHAAPNFAGIHLALLEACKTSPRCKRFIPSAWGGNLQDVPDSPIYSVELLGPVTAALEAQSEVHWTMICQGWFADYVVPSRQRHFRDIPGVWVQDHDKKEFLLYGRGTARVDFTSGRDTARAVGRLLNHDAAGWDRYTFLSGEHTTWKGLWEFTRERDPEYTVRSKSLTESIMQFAADPRGESEGQKGLVAMFEIHGQSEGAFFNPEKVAAQRERFFKGLKFRSLRDLVDEAEANSESIV